MIRPLLILLAFTASARVLEAAPPKLPDGFKAIDDVAYTDKDNPRQKLNLYVPSEKPAEPLPIIIYIHGGGWEGGSKDDPVFLPLFLSSFLAEGRYAGASIGYRLTNEAHFPDQIHDCKAALRWIASHADEYGIDRNRIALFGISAGGHLVSLLGTTVGDAELEGPLGVKVDVPVRPRCIANFCGPSNFLTFESQGSIFSGEKPGPVMKFFNGKISENQDKAKAASPELHVSSDDPPFLHIHGTKDTLVPYQQAIDFDKALDAAGVSSTLLTGEGAPHVFASKQMLETMGRFFDRHLLGKENAIEQGPIAIKD